MGFAIREDGTELSEVVAKRHVKHGQFMEMVRQSSYFLQPCVNFRVRARAGPSCATVRDCVLTQVFVRSNVFGEAHWRRLVEQEGRRMDKLVCAAAPCAGHAGHASLTSDTQLKSGMTYPIWRASLAPVTGRAAPDEPPLEVKGARWHMTYETCVALHRRPPADGAARRTKRVSEAGGAGGEQAASGGAGVPSDALARSAGPSDEKPPAKASGPDKYRPTGGAGGPDGGGRKSVASPTLRPARGECGDEAGEPALERGATPARRRSKAAPVATLEDRRRSTALSEADADAEQRRRSMAAAAGLTGDEERAQELARRRSHAGGGAAGAGGGASAPRKKVKAAAAGESVAEHARRKSKRQSDAGGAAHAHAHERPAH